ncbi:MAG: FG-GAP repeat domain-containing protein [Akkermansiaceae bacterium]
MPRTRILLKRLPLFLAPVGFLSSCQDSEVETETRNEVQTREFSKGTIEAPGLKERELVAPLADAWNRIDPSADGWDTEAFNEEAGAQLKFFKQALAEPDPAARDLEGLASKEFSSAGLRPPELEELNYNGREFSIRRWNNKSWPGKRDLAKTISDLRMAFAPDSLLQLETKLYRIEQESPTKIYTNILFHASGISVAGGRLQMNAEWRCHWTQSDASPLLVGIDLLSYEEVYRANGEGRPLFSDCTASALGKNPSYQNHLLRSTDHWRARFPRDLGLDVVANLGLVLADLNNDGLEDLYFCQQGGLPNRLYLRQLDGTLVDHTEESGAGWLDYSPAALAIDLDNDGDRDLIIALQFRLILMRNEGGAKFVVERDVLLRAQTFSLSAIDYDLDGDLDLYTCGYNASPDDLAEAGALGSPMPFHDAQNGGRNVLLKNEGNFSFSDVTSKTGLNQNNTRFSFAAAWEDYDRDGDPDLYVANDYGRNNLYRNDGSKFTDVARELGVEDLSSGMSVSWGDYNRDGLADIYVSNMFSSAGNRITFQKQFQDGKAGEALPTFQRFARGNTLFAATPGGGFKDVSVDSATTMARWAWGSRFADLDNDGWEDIVAANGFITAPDTGDL